MPKRRREESVGSDKKRHACQTCNARFTRSTSLVVHTRIHTGERPFACTLCDAKFVASGTLVSHMRTHTGQRPFACTLCNKRFTMSCSLVTHMRTHTGHKPFVCGACDKRFADSSTLRKHALTHTGERPFSCDVCNKCFSQSTSLVNHKRMHSGVRPFSCEVCDAQFTQAVHLKTHTLTHTGIKAFACDACNMHFARPAHCKAHVKRMHSEEGQQRQKRSEQRLANALTELGIAFKREHPIDYSCVTGKANNCARTDFLVLQDGVLNFVENDEHQHGDYEVSCETARMTRVFEALTLEGNTLPVRWIRFNPDGFRVDGTACKVPYAERIQRLAALLAQPTNQPLSIYYVCYDVLERQLAVLADADYPAALKPLVHACIPA